MNRPAARPLRHFEVILAGTDYMSEEDAERIYEAGCDDSLCGSSCGVATVSFDREAETLDAAIASALADLAAAGFRAASVRIEADDLAEMGLAPAEPPAVAA